MCYFQKLIFIIYNYCDIKKTENVLFNKRNFAIIVLWNGKKGRDKYMKAATGELNLTVITLIAIAAVIGFFWFMWPGIKESIQNQWNDINTYEQNDQSKSNG